MIYRTHVNVLRAVPGEYEWDTTVYYSFGINAQDTAEAVKMTVDAAKNAFDREGDYIGGVVLQVYCRYSFPEKFSGYEKYFLRPISEPGIFYVTGVTYTGTSEEWPQEVTAAELAAARDQISRFGLPTPSFAHPKWPDRPPTNVRMVCPVCDHWVEVSNTGLIFSFSTGIEPDSEEGREAIKAFKIASPFWERHQKQCQAYRIRGIQEDDPRWSTLDPTKRED